MSMKKVKRNALMNGIPLVQHSHIYIVTVEVNLVNLVQPSYRLLLYESPQY